MATGFWRWGTFVDRTQSWLLCFGRRVVGFVPCTGLFFLSLLMLGIRCHSRSFFFCC